MSDNKYLNVRHSTGGCNGGSRSSFYLNRDAMYHVHGWQRQVSIPRIRRLTENGNWRTCHVKHNSIDHGTFLPAHLTCCSTTFFILFYLSPNPLLPLSFQSPRTTALVVLLSGVRLLLFALVPLQSLAGRCYDSNWTMSF